MIDRDGIERDRDQLWAEAVARYRAGAKWWLETPELEALATVEQAKRFKVDEWEEPVKEWLGERQDTSLAEVLRYALGIAKKNQLQTAQNRVQKILTRLGFVKCRPYVDGKRKNRYRIPEKLEKQP
jgi:predicted P-loop ATPase